MLASKKQQGFIIRKTKNIDTDREERSKYFSQTQFLKMPRSQRSPGSILKIKFKEDVELISSRLQYENPEHHMLSKNNFANGYGFQFNYQETPFDLRQRDEGDLNQNSFEEIDGDPVSRNYGIDIDNSFELLKRLKIINLALQNRVCSGDTLAACREYFKFINEFELGDVSNLSFPSYRKKILKDSLLYERISVLLICFIEGVVEKFSESKSYLLNLNTYSIDNLLLRLAIITKGSNKQLVELLKIQKKENILSRGFDTIKNDNQIMAEAINKVAKYENLFHQNLKKIMKANKTMHVQGQISAILQYFAFFINSNEKSQKLPFLAVAPSPYLPQLQFPKYTLIVDVLQVFCSKSKKLQQTFRPFAEYFLDQMSQYYEIVSFCDAMPNQVNKIISLLDRKKHIKHRLYKYHLDKVKSFKGKDLSKIGRKLENVVLVDSCMQMDKNNTIVLNGWKGKKNDAELAQLCPLLALIALKKLNVKKAIKRIQEKMSENQLLGIKYLNCGLDIENDDLQE